MADSFSLNLTTTPAPPPQPKPTASKAPNETHKGAFGGSRVGRGNEGRADGPPASGGSGGSGKRPARPGRPHASGGGHGNGHSNGHGNSHGSGSGAPSHGRGGGRAAAPISSLFTGNEDGEELGAPVARKPVHVSHPRRTRNPAVFAGTHFSDLGLTDRLVRQLEQKLEVTKLTPAQQLAAPFLMMNRDVMLKSPTGTGKTLAYAVPIIQDLQGLQHRVKREDGPLALIITPTRELAQQSFTVMQSLLGAFAWIVPGAITGGEKKKSEKARLRKGINVLIATPGRLRDHIEHTRVLDLKSVRWLVLDEADRLMDAGFEKDIKFIVEALEEARHATNKVRRRTNVLVSATLTPDVQRLAKELLFKANFLDTTAPTDAGRIIAYEEPADEANDDSALPASDAPGRRDSAAAPEDDRSAKRKDDAPGSLALVEHSSSNTFTTSENLEQFYTIVPGKLRLMALMAFLKGHCQGADKGKAIIFCQSRNEVSFYQALIAAAEKETEKTKEQEEREKPLAEQLGPLSVYFLHGGMEQRDRTASFKGFCGATSGALVCTDVAARGLDLPAVSWILQMSAPPSAAEYVHRVGRTARLEASGKALLLLLPKEEEFIDVLQQHDLTIKAEPLMHLLGFMVPKHRASDEQAIRLIATRLQLGLERLILSQPPLAQIARDAFKAFIRAYATYPSAMKKVFHIKNLHLGHLAKSFALRETPQAIHGAGLPTAKPVKRGAAASKQGPDSGRPAHKRKKLSLSERMKLGANRAMTSEFG